MFNNFSSQNRVVYEIIRKKYGRTRHATDDSITWCMRIACWVTKVTGTYSQYVILIAIPLQQWLRKDDHRRWPKNVGRLQRL